MHTYYNIDTKKIIQTINDDNKSSAYSLDGVYECTLLNNDKAAPRDAPGVYTLTVKLKLVKK